MTPSYSTASSGVRGPVRADVANQNSAPETDAGRRSTSWPASHSSRAAPGLASWRMREPLSSRCSLAESGGRLPAVGRLRGAAPSLFYGRSPFRDGDPSAKTRGCVQRAGAIGSLGGEMLRPGESLAASAVSVTLGRLGGGPSETEKGQAVISCLRQSTLGALLVGGGRAPRSHGRHERPARAFYSPSPARLCLLALRPPACRSPRLRPIRSFRFFGIALI